MRTLYIISIIFFAVITLISSQLLDEQVEAPLAINEMIPAYQTASKQALMERTAIETMIGPFRGILIGGIGWKLENAMQNEEVFEMATLGEWLCALQPANGKVWGFLAHNLSYNIANTFPDGKSRFPWVMAGLKLLWQKGLKYAPESEQLKRELATILLGKFSISDEPTIAFNRAEYIRLMSRYLSTGKRAELEMMAYVDTEPQYFINYPEVKAYFELAERYRMRSFLELSFWNDPRLFDALKELGMVGPFADTPLRLIGLYHKTKLLKEQFCLSPARMIWVDSEYGPFDWRMPYGAVVYWDAQGGYDWLLKQRYARGNNIRISVQLNFQEGEPLDIIGENVIVTATMTEGIEKYIDYWTEQVKNLEGYGYEHYTTFLMNATATLYFAQKESLARSLHQKYILIDPKAEKNFDLFLEEATASLLKDDSNRNAQNLIENAIIQYHFSRSYGQKRQAEAYLKFAQMVWQRNNDEYDERYSAQRRLPPFNIMKAQIEKMLKEKNIMEDHGHDDEDDDDDEEYEDDDEEEDSTP